MTEPTKERCLYLADVIEQHPLTLGMQATKTLGFTENDCKQIVVALRLAANLPSEEKIAQIMRDQLFTSTLQKLTMDDIIGTRSAAARILERIRSVK